jgi:hypothetical protein
MNVNEWGHRSDGQIAKHSGISQNLVSNVRRQLQSDLSDDALQTYMREGEVQTMDTTTSTDNPRTQQVRYAVADPKILAARRITNTRALSIRSASRPCLRGRTPIDLDDVLTASHLAPPPLGNDPSQTPLTESSRRADGAGARRR